jgi:hypothetical protein
LFDFVLRIRRVFQVPFDSTRWWIVPLLADSAPALYHENQWTSFPNDRHVDLPMLSLTAEG